MYINKNMYAFIDESGDIGFTDKSTKYFILTAFLISELLQIADFVSWSVFQFYEKNVKMYYEFLEK
jgi:hypothetical protein